MLLQWILMPLAYGIGLTLQNPGILDGFWKTVQEEKDYKIDMTVLSKSLLSWAIVKNYGYLTEMHRRKNYGIYT